MNDEDDPTLLAAAEAVTDGMSVDWTNLKQKNPALVEELAIMEAMAEVALAYRRLRDEGDPSRP